MADDLPGEAAPVVARTLNAEDVAEATLAIVAELTAVDACLGEWFPEDQTRYVRLLLEDGIDGLARADDAHYDYMADCVLLAGQNMQDARLQMVEDRLGALESGPGQRVEDLVIDTAIMLGFELAVVAGAEVLVPAFILWAAGRVLSRATRQLSAAGRAVSDSSEEALAKLLSDAIDAEAVAAKARSEWFTSLSAEAYRAERKANREARTAWAKLQVGRAAAGTSEATFHKAQIRLDAATADASRATLVSTDLKAFLDGAIGGTAVGRVAENVAADLTGRITATTPPSSSAPDSDSSGPLRTFLTSVVAGRFLSEIRREQEEAARAWRRLRFYIRSLRDDDLLQSQVAQELYLRIHLFAPHPVVQDGLVASREFLVLGMEAQLWLAWLTHINALGRSMPTDFTIHQLVRQLSIPPQTFRPGMVYEDKLILEVDDDTPVGPGTISPRGAGNVDAKGIPYPGLLKLTDGHADYLYSRFAKPYFVRGGAAPAPLVFDAARYDGVASMPEKSPLGFDNLDRLDRLAEMKLLVIVFFRALVANPALIGGDDDAASTARKALREVMETPATVDFVSEYVATLPGISEQDGPADPSEPPTDAVGALLDALAVGFPDPEGEAKAAAARLADMVTDLDLAITRYLQEPKEDADDPGMEGMAARAFLLELEQQILTQQEAVLEQQKLFRKLAEGLDELLAETGAAYDDRIAALTTWMRSGSLLP